MNTHPYLLLRLAEEHTAQLRQEADDRRLAEFAAAAARRNAAQMRSRTPVGIPVPAWPVRLLAALRPS